MIGHFLRPVRSLVALMAETSPYKTAASALLMLVLTFTEGVTLLLLAPLLGLVGVVNENPLPRARNWLDSAFAAIGLEVTLGSALLLLVGVTVLRAVARRWEARLISTVREDLVRTYRLRLYRAIAAAEWRFLVTRTPWEFAHAVSSEVGRVGVAITHITDLAVLVLASVVYLALAIRLSPAIALLVMISAAILGWSVRGSLSKARAVSGEAAMTRNRLHGTSAEHVASLKTARSYGALSRHAEIFGSFANASHDLGVRVSAGEIDLQQRLELGSTILLAIIVFTGASIIDVPPALLLVLLFVFARLMPRLINIYKLAQALATALPVVDALNALEQQCLAAAEAAADDHVEIPFARSIRFDDVSFDYLRRDGPAVHGLNLEIAAGVTTAIVGASGSGKTTTADLLMGLLQPTTGRILIDGEPLTSRTLSSWRQQISYVAQDPFLFDDSVRANLVWARAGATDEDLWACLRLAAADGFVAELPQGLDTVVGERGVMLSGGERQRLSIARALLRNPRILLLDEATSSLDIENEQRIQQAIDALRHRLTIIVITHRLSTIRHADVIHVMDQGRVIQSGTWDELSLVATGR